MVVYVSQPKLGYTVEEINKRETDILENVSALLDEQLTKQTIIDIPHAQESIGAQWCIDIALHEMNKAKIVIFAYDWYKDMQCILEFYTAMNRMQNNGRLFYEYYDFDHMRQINFSDAEKNSYVVRVMIKIFSLKENE